MFHLRRSFEASCTSLNTGDPPSLLVFGSTSAEEFGTTLIFDGDEDDEADEEADSERSSVEVQISNDIEDEAESAIL